MIRGTTPTHIFTFEDFDPSELNVLNIYYAQQGEIILEKHKSDCSFSENQENHTYTASVTLTQEETKLFKVKNDVEVQVRVLTSEGKSLATPKYRLPIHDVLNDEILE